jgi:hypothetical protein
MVKPKILVNEKVRRALTSNDEAWPTSFESTESLHPRLGFISIHPEKTEITPQRPRAAAGNMATGSSGLRETSRPQVS